MPGAAWSLRRGGVERGRDSSAAETGGPAVKLWDRSLDRYPNRVARYWYLAIVVVSAIVLYYEFYVPAAVTPSIIADYHMTWPFFVYVIVVGNLIGAFASLIAGLADRWGRANLVAYGLLVTGLIVLVGIPNAPDLWVYAVLYGLLGFVEGIILVATPALIRDFSPQLGRATAMGFWTIGPVVASLTVSLVASHTLNHLHAWQDQFTITGITGLIVWAIAFVGLRELSPGLRDQLMVSIRDRALVEARASGVDIEESLRHPMRKVLHLDVVGPSFGIGLFLVVYYTLIAFLVVYMATNFGYTLQRANALGNWVWGFNAGALVVVGLLSDWARVRKPFMVLGIAGSAAATSLLAVNAIHPHTSYYTFVWILSLLSVSLGFTFAPWLAAFTETVEAHSPALAATGLAIWGWVLRLVVAASLFLLPYVVTTMTPLVEHGTEVATLSAKYAPEIQTLSAIDAQTLGALSANPADAAAAAKAVGEIATTFKVSPAVALQRLQAVATVPPAALVTLRTYGPKVEHAAAVTPHEWQRWWWVSVGCEIVLLPFLLIMRGRWSPAKARRDAEEHEKMVQEALAALHR